VKRVLLAAALVLLAGCGAPASGPAPRVVVTDAWARATAGQASAGAAYVTLQSPGGDRLVGLGVSPAVARFTQMHETVRRRAANGASEVGMRHVESIALPRGERVAFAPGQRHIMLLELARPLAVGDTFALALAFERARPETVRVPVRDE
jgi:periplasmic copper chaperone A